MNLRFAVSIITVASLALPAFAQDAPASGCYERIYSASHLAENPNQGVESMRVLITNDPDDAYVGVFIAARMSTQGQARIDRVAGQVLEQGLFCPRDGSAKCYVECDGGGIQIISQSPEGLTFRTSGMRIGDDGEGCGGQSDLAEPGAEATTYRLNAVARTLCEGLEY